jgi:hypothetical protein
MKKSMMMLALVGMTAGVAVNAENTQNAAAAPAQKTQVATAPAAKAPEAAAVKLSADEQAFASKLNDQNRKAFSDKLSADQRKSVMVAVKNGASADEAVQRMVAAKEMKDSPSVANAEKAAAPQAK